MKLKNLVFIIVIMLLILIIGSSTVKAEEFKTWFYEVNPGDWYIGRELNFNVEAWYKSYNIFCTNARLKTPENFTAYNRMDTSDGRYFAWQRNEGMYTDEQTVKFLYIFSTLNDEMTRTMVSSRTNNRETPQQQAIWTILGQTYPKVNGVVTPEHPNTNQILAEANAYYKFWISNGADVEPTIDASNVKLENGVLGPFVVTYNEFIETINKNSKTYVGSYGGIETVELLKIDDAGQEVAATVYYDKIRGINDNININKTTSSSSNIYIGGINNSEEYNAIRVKFNNQYVRDAYMVLGKSKREGQQTSMFGVAGRYTTEKIARFNIDNELCFNLGKRDATTGKEMANVTFNSWAKYYDEAGNLVDSVKLPDVTTNYEGVINYKISKPETKRVDLYMNEITVEGYYHLGYTIKLSFEYKDNKWQCLGYEKDKNIGYSSPNENENNDGNIIFVNSDINDKTYSGTLYITNKSKEKPFLFRIKKLDSKTGKPLEGVKFKIGYDYSAMKTYITEDEGEITIPIVPLEGKDSMLINIHEESPDGYKSLGYGVQLKFDKKDSGWECVKVSKISFDAEVSDTIYENGEMILTGEMISFTKATDGITGTLLIKNEPEDELSIKLKIYKVDANNKNLLLSGAKFSISVENGKADRNSFTIDESEQITIVPEDRNKPVIVTLNEIKAPSGYKKLSGSIELIYKYKIGADGLGDWVLDSKTGSMAQVSGNIVRIKNKPKTPDNPDNPDDPDYPDNPDNPDNPDTIEGYVYLDGYSGNKKVSKPNGTRDSGEQGIKGVIVKLSNGRTTVTNENGYYKFTNLAKGHSYTLTFGYDGINYEATVGTQATETSRSNFNNKFTTINVGETRKGISLEYWAYGDSSNWNPVYDGKAGWLLKTLNKNQIVNRDDFKIAAETTVKTSNEEESQTYRVDHGLVKREVDLSLVNDLKNVKVSINGKTTIYDYEDIPVAGDTVDIGNVSSDNNNKTYVLELNKNDFLYGSDKYNYSDTESKLKEYSANNKLKVEATYKVVLNNQSNTKSTVNSIVYYFDTNYTFKGVSQGTASNVEKVTIDGKEYNKIDITGLKIELAEGGQGTIEIYLEINAVGSDIKQETYKTIAEITSYSTADGKVDLDSAPGNAVQAEKYVYEDDTDAAPGLKITAEGKRYLSGNVWEDKTEKQADGYKAGNGIKDNGEDGIGGVKVQLIEIKEIDGIKHYYIWKEEATDANGDYEFSDFIPGNYIVRFIYGSSPETNIFNGVDYKSATDVNYDLYKSGKWYNDYHNNATNTSVARDNEARRLNVMADTAEIGYDLGTQLKKSSEELYKRYMYADTSKINIAVASEDGKETSNLNEIDGKIGTYNNFLHVNFALEKRPETKITLEKHVTGLRVTANDGTTIVDANFDKIIGKNIVSFTNESVIKGLKASYSTRDAKGSWHLEADIEEVIQGATLELVYTYTVKNESELDYISTDLAQKFENQSIADYKTTLRDCANIIGEDIAVNDYNSKLGDYLGKTYYTGKKEDNVSVVKTHVGQIEDYLNNDLKFTEVTSSDFKINNEESGKEYKLYKPQKSTESWSEAKERINTVVITKQDVGKLAPNETITKTILLASNGKLTATGKLNFPGYIAQIKTAYHSPIGRQDVKSIPENLKYIDNYTLEGNEPDEYWTEEIVITKPTGQDKQTAVRLAVSITAGLTVLAAGIITIKKYLV